MPTTMLLSISGEDPVIFVRKTTKPFVSKVVNTKIFVTKYYQHKKFLIYDKLIVVQIVPPNINLHKIIMFKLLLIESIHNCGMYYT